MTKTLIAVVLSTALIAAETRITPPKNKYTPAQDVELGQQAAAEARQKLPVMRDESVSSYTESIGRRLAQAIPAELRHAEFRYTFETVNVREINAFALPGGPMFINRGMIEAAHSEGEVAGVMAHELSHVVLRHGTAQASAATPYEIGTVAGAILGAIIGGRVGSVVAQGTQFGLGAAFMRFSRAYEHDADIEGSQIMARAGYDPREMASMFKTIEAKGGSGGPEWLSDHPNPGNRYEYITAEAQSLRVENPIRDTRGFQDVQAHLRSLSPAPTTEQATKNASSGRDTTTPRGTTGAPPTGAAPTGRVQPPSNSMTGYKVGNVFQVKVPSNWRQQQANSSVTFAPQGGYGQYNGQPVFTHGIEIGISRNEAHDLQTATDELIDSLGQGNPNMSRGSGYSRASIGNRQGLRTILSNTSEVTGRPESVELFTALLKDGSLFYAIGVAPRDEFGNYQTTFQRVVGSIQLTN
jgi:Zn-dependent protease with chaperone function